MAQVVQDIVMLMLTHLSMKIVTYIFWVGDTQDPNIFGCKIFSESIFLGLNWTLHTHTPLYRYSKYPLGVNKPKTFPSEHLKTPITFVGLSGLNVWPKNTIERQNKPYKSIISPSFPDPLIRRTSSPYPSVGVFHLNVEACDRNLELALCLSKTHKWPASTYTAEAF